MALEGGLRRVGGERLVDALAVADAKQDAGEMDDGGTVVAGELGPGEELADLEEVEEVGVVAALLGGELRWGCCRAGWDKDLLSVWRSCGVELHEPVGRGEEGIPRG